MTYECNKPKSVTCEKWVTLLFIRLMIYPLYPRNHCNSVYPQWFASPVLHLRDPWLGCERSWVRNQDKTSGPLFLVLSSFINLSLPSHIRTSSVLGLKKSCWCDQLSWARNFLATLHEMLAWLQFCCYYYQLSIW